MTNKKYFWFLKVSSNLTFVADNVKVWKKQREMLTLRLNFKYFVKIKRMTMNKKTLLYFVLLVGFTFSSCLKEPKSPAPTGKTLSLPDVPYAYSSQIDIGRFGAPVIISNVNPENPDVTPDGATLGRVLFYDPALSLNNRVACASCHLQKNAFADGLAHSVGFEGKITPRNSMAINNPVLNRSLFWDSRATSATNLALQPAQNHVEMGMEDLDFLASKLSKIDYYPDLFVKAFGPGQITKENIGNALAQFLCSMTTMNSKFDKVKKNEANFTALEQLGSDIFNGSGKCRECHSGSNFMADDSPSGPYGGTTSSGLSVAGTANTGLDRYTVDEGRNNGSFRIPSLRNIAVTGPYMHDGRFKTLEDVIDFYSHDIQAHDDLDPKLKVNGVPIRFNFTELEKQALIAFLNTLTDEEYLTAEQYSSPFK